jgi:hypothetical protein
LEEFELFLPAQLLHSILDSSGFKSITETTSIPQVPKLHVQACLPLYKFPRATRSWIPAVGRWLSHDWIDINQVSSKAVKRGDAQIATGMRDQRLVLLYPQCTVGVLTALCTLLLKYSRWSLLRDLLSHLRVKFGETWCQFGVQKLLNTSLMGHGGNGCGVLL